MSSEFILILGGARSGKSTFAQTLASDLGEQVLFVATAEPLDEDMTERINDHKRLRPKHWRTLEVSHNVAQELPEHLPNVEVVLLDCITLLVSNLVVSGNGENVLKEIEELVQCLDGWGSTFIAISNEVGLGIVPGDKLSRDYRDLLGKVNQLLAKHASQVYVMAAGIPVKVKG
ncbi:MAG: bifunctional adenosylcobinamide kinase/adenosylcobinamide-phosphate guanylyltransferase [Dehalococcoidia bacterium]